MEITSYTRLTLCPRKTGKELICIGTSYAGQTIGMCKEKSRAPRTATFALSMEHYLLSTHPETTAFSLCWRSGNSNDSCSPTKSNLSPLPFSQLFQKPVIIFTSIFFKLSAYSLFALELYVSSFNRFFLLPPQLSPSSHMPPGFTKQSIWSL